MSKISKNLMEEYLSSKKRYESAEDEVLNIIYKLLEEKNLHNRWLIREIKFNENTVGVWVEETWRYGGEDKEYFEFPLSEIVEASYLRKEKLKNIERVTK